MLVLALVCSTCLHAQPPAKNPLDFEGAVAQLSADDFQIRQAAYEWLEKWAGENLRNSPEALSRVWRASEDPEAKTRCYQLMKEMFMRRDSPGKGFLGITMMDFLLHREDQPLRVVRVSRVWPDTAASKAGLMLEDLILRVDDVDFGNADLGFSLPTEEFSKYIKSKHPGEVVTLHILRGAKTMQIKVTLMQCPPHADPDGEKARLDAERMFENWLKKMDG